MLWSHSPVSGGKGKRLMGMMKALSCNFTLHPWNLKFSPGHSIYGADLSYVYISKGDSPPRMLWFLFDCLFDEIFIAGKHPLSLFPAVQLGWWTLPNNPITFLFNSWLCSILRLQVKPYLTLHLWCGYPWVFAYPWEITHHKTTEGCGWLSGLNWSSTTSTVCLELLNWVITLMYLEFQGGMMVHQVMLIESKAIIPISIIFINCWLQGDSAIAFVTVHVLWLCNREAFLLIADVTLKGVPEK